MTLLTKLSTLSAPLPDTLQTLAADFCANLSEKLPAESLLLLKNPRFAASILKVCLSSRFVSDNWLRRPELILELAESGDLFSGQRRNDYPTALKNLSIDQSNLGKQLRIFRRREMLRIAWRDLAGWADLDETLADLTALAEACLETALETCYQQACQRWGIPVRADGNAFNLVVLGMGKLGAWELNFSSDIDLIFAFAEDGVLNEHHPKNEISHHEFFSKIIRNLVRALDEITADGFVFRTDLRLRPFGDSGPLVMTFEGMEHYYLTQAREWERYAMIKARQVAGDFVSGKELQCLIKAFVYRRYLDYGAFEELRGLKLQIMQELKRKDKLENVKLGPGGIREIEFIGQAFQLIRGGQETALQQREIQTVLTVLAEQELMSAEEVAELKTAYRFLRRVENHIQQYQDAQTHDLPNDPLRQQILAYSLDFSDWSTFKQVLDDVRKQVHSIFDDVFSLSELDSKQQTACALWTSDNQDELALEILAEYAYQHPAAILQCVVDFKESHAVKRLSGKGLGVVQRLLPKLLKILPELASDQEQTLKRILEVFNAVAGRNVYLSLLAENPDALKQLIKLCDASLWICESLARYPILFDELLDVRSLYEPLRKSALSTDLQRELARHDRMDSEQLMIVLRQFKHLNLLRVAAADIMGVIPVMVVSDYLTWTAEAIIAEVLEQAWLLLVDKHGFPPGTGSDIKHFAILGFGKFGGIEMGYGSDLDLVFLYNCPDDQAQTTGEKPISCGQFYLRLGHKIRHILDTKMLYGVLYDVDMRLRPNGDSGLLVTHLDSYEDYLLNQAWTFEHQALVRARFIAGDSDLEQKFLRIRSRILGLNRDQLNLKTQVSEMRYKMRASRSIPATLFDVKHSPGGIADIEFIVQFGVLAQAAQYPALTVYTDNVRLLEGLQTSGFINANDASLLKTAYCSFRDYGHHRILQGHRATAEQDEFTELREEVQRIWELYFGAA